MDPLPSLVRELELPPHVISSIRAHAGAVEREGDRLGLVSSADLSAVVGRHSADSLLFALARRPRPGEEWADVGSGAGFPGLVLAICFPATRFALIEPQRRRAAFLELQVLELDLGNVTVRADRVEQLDAAYDVAVARAFTDPRDAFPLLKRVLGPDGEAIVAAGRDAEVPVGARVVDVSRSGVDSPGRLLMMA